MPLASMDFCCGWRWHCCVLRNSGYVKPNIALGKTGYEWTAAVAGGLLFFGI
jgi:hypothetical protein